MNIQSPLISVIMSVRNDGFNVGNSIKSILDQSYSNFELLVLDDSSTDNTFEKINEFKDSRLTIFQNSENLGLTKSLNLLINKTKGEYIARQDSDDISFKERFEKQLIFIKKYNLDACTTRAVTKSSNRKIPGLSINISPKILVKFKNPFIHGSLMIKKNILSQINLYDEKFYYAQDFKLLSDLINSNYKIKILKEVNYLLNDSDNISTKFKSEQKKYANLVLKNNRKITNIF